MQISLELIMILIPIPFNSRAPNCIWAILILMGLLLPLQTMAEQTSDGVPYVVDIQGVTAGPAEVGKLLREVSQAVQKKEIGRASCRERV